MAKKYQFDLTYPLDMMYHVVSQEHGENPSTYKKYIVQGVPLKGHNGTDFAPTDYQSHDFWPVDDGTVSFVGWDPLGFGNYLDIQHTWGKSRYAHASVLYVKVGQKVTSPKFGQNCTVLGKTGYTGFVMPDGPMGTHLHLGIYPTLEPKTNGYGGCIDPRRPDNYFTILATGITTPSTQSSEQPLPETVTIPAKGVVVVDTWAGLYLRPDHTTIPNIFYVIMPHGTKLNFTGETFIDANNVVWGKAECWFAMKIGNNSLTVKNELGMTTTVSNKVGR